MCRTCLSSLYLSIYANCCHACHCIVAGHDMQVYCLEQYAITNNQNYFYIYFSPGALDFDPEKNGTKLIFSGYLQNINKNKISKVPKFPHCAKFFTAIIQNGRVFGLTWSRQMMVCLGKMWYIVVFSGF